MTETGTRGSPRSDVIPNPPTFPAVHPRDETPSVEAVHSHRETLRDWLTKKYSEPTADYAVNTLRMWGKYGHQSPYVAPIWEYALVETNAALPYTEEVQQSYSAWNEENRMTHPHAESGSAISYPRAPDALRAAIEDISIISRQTLHDSHGERIHVYRGIDEHVWENHTDILPDGGVRIKPLAMESWTLDKAVAEPYGRYTLERTIDVEDVLFYGDIFMSERPEEREMAIGGYNSYEIPFEDLSWDRR